MIEKNERLNVDRLNLKLAFSKFISNEIFSLDWKQVAKSTPLLQDMTALNSSKIHHRNFMRLENALKFLLFA